MMQVVGSKRRKRSRNGGGSVEEISNEGQKQTKVYPVEYYLLTLVVDEKT